MSATNTIEAIKNTPDKEVPTSISFSDLINRLRKNPVESLLAEITEDYWHIPRGHFINGVYFTGFYLVRVNEGLVVLPYDDVIVDHGYEHFEIGYASLVTPENIDQITYQVSTRLKETQAALLVLKEMGKRRS